MDSEYKITEYTYRFLKEAEKTFNSVSRSGEKRLERATKSHNISRKEEAFLESIRKDVVHRKETIKDIVLQCSDTSFKIYSEEIKRLSWENSKLREELRKENHVKDRKGNEAIRQERIISQKNEQIRKISQELEKTSSELKKVKTGRNKKKDQPKNDKNGRSASGRKRREKILKIPVLPEIADEDPQRKDARDIFFYDIPKFWSEEEVRTNLMKLGKVIRIQIRGQYKYKTVKAKLILNKNFEQSFKEGYFGVCISKHFIRWYDAKIDLKGRQERDKWQVVRDLTNEEMEAIKTKGVYEFTKQLQNGTKMRFTKIIKITKNWKVIRYFTNQKEMEEAVEDSCTKGDIKRVWLVRNKKTIYREEKKLKKDKIPPSPAIPHQSEPTTPITPEARVYRELGVLNGPQHDISRIIPPKYFGNKALEPHKPLMPSEDEVVDTIKKWRLTDEPSHDQFDDRFEKGKQPEIPKKDNVAPEEVVEVIKEYRSGKSNYTRLSDSPNVKEVREKMTEIRQIFEANYQEMEWTIIQGETIKEMREETQIFGKEEFKNWMLQEANYLIVAKKIIVRTENHGLFQEFAEMNEDFSKRLEDENRYQDNKEIGEKRPILESPEAPE
ncbi:hypothetical protein RhiirA4_479610 [Rhizophagus irregularis]|uniref:Uncharacterized protein n=1 Tax=Rhizophagus irregularis TaxID=588596 RepID=A0A2I1HGP3_9GLOM|nr:hypothetical protein RhiirA4_479610 [Rhizophagus irregularis]